MTHTPSDANYRRLLELRTGPRRFLRGSEREAEGGLTPAHDQLLLAIRGHADPRGPTLGDVAARLLLRHHSAARLVDRAEAAGLVGGGQDRDNLSAVSLTATGSRHLEALSELHLEELAHLAPTMQALWESREQGADGDAAPHPAAPPPDVAARRPRSRARG